MNENSNGLLQQYFPKMRLTGVPEEQVQWAVDHLNHRPCKVLGFRTPHEVFFGVSANSTNQSSEVPFEFESMLLYNSQT
nr:hypothetical protein [Nitrosomonas communis]